MDFAKQDCATLKKYLQQRGISTTAYKKESLVKLARCAEDIALQTDPDHRESDSVDQLKRNLQELGFHSTDPFSLHFGDSFHEAPRVGLYDIFNYLIRKRTDFDQKATKAYKSFEDYRLFYDGHVLDLKCNVSETFCCYFARVRPTQRQKTYQHQDSYKLWILADRDGDIQLAYCQCPGG